MTDIPNLASLTEQDMETLPRRQFVRGLCLTVAASIVAPAATSVLGLKRSELWRGYQDGRLPGGHEYLPTVEGLRLRALVTDGRTSVFQLAHVPLQNTETVFLNGRALDRGEDYLISGNRITLRGAPSRSDKLRISYFGRLLDPRSYVTMKPLTPAVNGVSTSFTLTTAPLENSVILYLNGFAQDPVAESDYGIHGSLVNFIRAPGPNDVLLASYYEKTPGPALRQVTMETPEPASGGYMLARTPWPRTETIYLNGLALNPATDYRIERSVIRLAGVLAPSDKLRASYFFQT